MEHIMSIQFQPAALAGAIALALGFTSSVHATEQKVATTSLDTIVVTATRSEENIKNVSFEPLYFEFIYIKCHIILFLIINIFL